MKKIVFLIALACIGSVCVAQRTNTRMGGTRGSVPTRTSVSTRTSMSTSHSTPSRSSMSTRSSNPSRNNTATYRSSNQSAPRTANFRRSDTRSGAGTTNPTPAVRNASRSQNNDVSRNYGETTHPTPRHSEAKVHGRPHSGPNAGYRHHVRHIPHGMHPAPPMYHPIHRRPIHMHYHLYDHNYWIVRNLYWYGYWNYVHTYPYNEVVVYVGNTRPGTEILAIATDENYVYTIYRDNYMNETYFTISDKDDNVLVKTVVNRKYCKLATDGNGVWLMKKRDKDPMYFMYQDGELYRYEED